MAATATATANTETFAFQAEINDLMSLIINTFYSNKDIFVRELISNASDAIDKARHQLLVNGGDMRDFEIKLMANKEQNTLTIEDNGVGMTKEELVSNLGTIANSGTKQFMRKLLEDKKEKKEADGSADGNTTNPSMIGQFGVGFYSAFLAASGVKVITGKNCWESSACGTFTITDLEDESEWVKHGCKLVLQLKEGCEEYAEESKLTDIVKQHSQFIDHPIKLWTTRVETKEVDDDGEEDADADKGEQEAEEGKIEEVTEEPEKKEKKTKTVETTVEEWKCLNTTKPIWTRNPKDVTPEEYAGFYKAVTNAWDEPLKTKHYFAEGQIEYKAILFVPKNPPFDMFQSTKRNKCNVKLYVKRVLLMDNCEDLIPEWLRFVSGVIDCEDLPLNVSREMLQQNSVINVIKKSVVKKCIEMFNEMTEDEESYLQFYDQFSQNLKLGVHEDSANREKLVKLLRFDSAKLEKPISLKEYVENMQEDQKEIYHITGESRTAVQNSPFTRGLLKKGLDVLLMTDAIDEYMCQNLREYDDKKLVNITKDHGQFYESNEDLDNHLCKRMKSVLGVSKVVVSTRLDQDPCCILSSQYGWSANMQRIIKAQAMQNNQNHFMMSNNDTSQNVLEINPSHKMIKQLQEGILKSTMKDGAIDDIIRLMYETCMISCGYSHDDPTSFSNRVYRVISLGLPGAEEEEEEEGGEQQEEQASDGADDSQNMEALD